MNHMPEAPADHMQAAQMIGAGKMRIRPVPLPRPQAGEVRVKLEGCGVCASNPGPGSGPEWMEFPKEPGCFGYEGEARSPLSGEASAASCWFSCATPPVRTWPRQNVHSPRAWPARQGLTLRQAAE